MLLGAEIFRPTSLELEGHAPPDHANAVERVHDGLGDFIERIACFVFDIYRSKIARGLYEHGDIHPGCRNPRPHLPFVVIRLQHYARNFVHPEMVFDEEFRHALLAALFGGYRLVAIMQPPAHTKVADFRDLRGLGADVEDGPRDMVGEPAKITFADWPDRRVAGDFRKTALHSTPR